MIPLGPEILFSDNKAYEVGSYLLRNRNNKMAGHKTYNYIIVKSESLVKTSKKSTSIYGLKRENVDEIEKLKVEASIKKIPPKDPVTTETDSLIS